MLTRSLWEAMHTAQESLEDVKVVTSAPAFVHEFVLTEIIICRNDFVISISFIIVMFGSCFYRSIISLHELCALLQIDKSLPRICFLSGLSGEEMVMFVDAFQETGNENLFSAQVLLINRLTNRFLLRSLEFLLCRTKVSCICSSCSQQC